MNILFYLTRYPGIGGIENVTNIIVQSLIENNRVTILSHMQQDGVKSLDNVTLYKMPNAKQWSAHENYAYAEKIILENHFDAIIYQDSYAPTEHIVCEVAKKYSVPLYAFEHNSPLFVYLKKDIEPITTVKGFLRRVFTPYLLYCEIRRKRYILEHATKYVLLSKKFIPEFCRLIGVNENDTRITYINNPTVMDAKKIDSQRENIILCVSRLVKEKNVDKMLALWKVFSIQLPDWRFVIVGDGPERSKLELYARKHNLPRIEFVGFAKPGEYYEKAKIFWMTSQFEGWGMTLIEAMQKGCVPIVYQTFSSVTDIIDDGENGFLIKPFDEKAFLNSTIRLAKDNELWISLSHNSVIKVKEFSIERVLQDWKNLLNLK